MAENKKSRAQIQERSAEKFFSHGYSRVTMDEIANDLGMSKKTLYKYFPAKADLLEAVVLNFIQEVVNEQNRILSDETLDFEMRLSELMKVLARLIARISPILMRDVQRSVPQVWKIIEETRQQRINMIFGGLLKEGQQKGYIREDIHLPFVVYFITAAIRETINPRVVSRFTISLVEAFDTIRMIFMGGVLTDRGREKFLNATSFAGKEEQAWHL